MHRKGQGLPLNTIIIAIIVLVVLVVIVAIFTGRIGKFETSLSSEEQQAKVQAEALKSSGNLQTGECGTSNGEGLCTAPANCAYGNLLRQPPSANPDEWCVQGLVCCRT